MIVPYTNYLVDYAFEIRNKRLNDDDITQIKKTIVDFYSSAIPGSKTNISKKVYHYLLTKSINKQAVAIGFDDKLSVEDSALINGTSAHALDLDDGHTGGSFHPGSVVISAVLSKAENLKVDSEKIFKAIIIGYEISIRIASTIHPASRENGFHNTPIAGIFGAVVAVATLMNMSKEKVLSALGIAGSFASGLFAFLGSGSDIKRIHPGKAAMDAIVAVKLSNNGLTGPMNILENENGVLKAFARNTIEKNLLNPKDHEKRKYLIHDVYFKPYPCCRHLHSGIDAVYLLKENNDINIRNIKSISIGVNKMAYLHRHKVVNNMLDAQMSLPYAIAAAFYYDQLNIKSFETEFIPKEIEKLKSVINVYLDEDLEQQYPEKRASIVKVIFEDGKKLSEYVGVPLGEPANPLSYQQLKDKYMNNCQSIIGKEKVESFIGNIDEWNVNSSNQFLFNV